MELFKDKVSELMQNYCDGNYNRFARELDVDVSQLYRFIKTGVGGGSKVIGGVIKFCKVKNLNFEDYIRI
jgi:hypothetical protein